MSRYKNIFIWLVLMNPFVGPSVLMPARATAQSATFISSPHKRKSGRPQFVTVRTTRLHYVESGSGKPVLLIHGNAGSLQDFEFGTLDLVAQQYRVIAFDLPGHGFSPIPKSFKGTIEEEASILHDALNELGVKAPIVVGHSWGGAIALAYALRYPQDVSGLVLLAPAAYPDHRRETRFGGLLKVPVLGDVCISLLKPFIGHRQVEHGLAQAFFPDNVPEEYRKAAASAWLGRKQIKAWIQSDEVLEDSLRSQSTAYEKIQSPVIIVTGDSDQVVLPSQNAFPLHSAIKKSELLVVLHAGHQIPEAHPEVVLRAIQLVRPESKLATIAISK
jgi:pimeloyl-ACP methyl ester carboxylesterase